MTEYISERDFAGRPFAVVRDERGTRIGFREIPRGHQILLVAVLTVDPETGKAAIGSGGETQAQVADGTADVIVNGWTAVLQQVLAASGIPLTYETENYRDNGRLCPFHGEIH